MQQLRHIHEHAELEEESRFVYFCSQCDCIIDVSSDLKPAGGLIDSLENRCPGCGSALDEAMTCRMMRVAREWMGIQVSDHTRRQTKTRSFFTQASSLLKERRGLQEGSLTFNFGPLDELVGRIDSRWLTAFRGDCSGAAAELLCLRAQLPREEGGLDSGAVFLDGGNCSDPYLFATYAERHGVKPKTAMRRVVTSRAFTVYQLTDVITKLPRVAEDHGARIVIIADVLGMFNDPALHPREAERLVEAIGSGIVEVRRKTGALVLATLATKTPYDSVVTDRADVLVSMDSAGPRVDGSLLRHPGRAQSSSSFSRSELLLSFNAGVNRPWGGRFPHSG